VQLRLPFGEWILALRTAEELDADRFFRTGSARRKWRVV